MIKPTPAPVEPHPILEKYYGDRAEKREWLQTIFDDTAPDYDRIESWLALGSGRWYRRRALHRAGLTSGMAAADVACGTGLVTREAARIVGPTGRIVGIDPSVGMMNHAGTDIVFERRHGRAEAIPENDAAFDFLSMGYALRHVDDFGSAFREFRRVLRPGGRVCILEITAPASGLGRALLRLYMRVVVGVCRGVAGGSARSGELWTYYWETIDRCARPETVMQALRSAGFDNVRHTRPLGIFSEYTGVNPPAGNPCRTPDRGSDETASTVVPGAIDSSTRGREVH